MRSTDNHLLRLNELMKDNAETKKYPLNYANYTKENYNILTLQNHNNYYQQFQEQIPVYVREQPDWSKSLYKRKNNKVNQYNYIMFRNVQNIKKKNNPYGNSNMIPRESLYKAKDPSRGQSVNRTVANFSNKGKKESSVVGTLPLIKRKGKSVSEARSVSHYNSKSSKKSVTNKTFTSEAGKISKADQLIKRAEQLAKFIQTVNSEETKETIRAYARDIITKLNESDITKERMRIAILESADDLQKIFEENLGIKLDLNEPKNNAEEIIDEPNDQIETTSVNDQGKT